MLRVRSLSIILLAFFLFAAPARGEHLSVITLLYTTDVHGRIMASDKALGLDTVAAVKAATPNSLLLDAGDFLSGLQPARLDDGRHVVALMKEAGYFAVAAGNHEFSVAPDVWAARFAEAAASPLPMPVLSANIVRDDGSLLLQPWVKADVGGVAVCVLGLSTRDTATHSDPECIRGLSFLEPAKEAARQIPGMRAAGCEVVVALAHLGSMEENDFEAQTLGCRVPAIDAVIDGHSHAVLNVVTEKGAHVVNAGEYCERIGKLELWYDKKKKAVVKSRNTFLGKAETAGIQPDPVLQAKLAALEQMMEKRLGSAVGFAERALSGSKRHLRTRESGLGNACADAARLAVGADMAVVNAGTIRADLPEGVLTNRHVQEVLPYRNRIVRLPLTGGELLDILENGFSALPIPDGRFPQVSGLVVEVRPENPAGRRVLTVSLPDGTPIGRDTVYNVAVNSFMAHGGDGYPRLTGREGEVAGPYDADSLVWLLLSKGVSGYSDDTMERIVMPAREGERTP